MIATRRPTVFSAERMRLMRSAWLARSPCEKLSRATFRPARISRSSISGVSEAGPMVATILVLFLGSVMTVIDDLSAFKDQLFLLCFLRLSRGRGCLVFLRIGERAWAPR